MKILVTAFLVLSVFLLQTDCFAGDGSGKRKGGKAGKDRAAKQVEQQKDNEKKSKKLAKLDTNGDGVISEEERMAAKKAKPKEKKAKDPHSPEDA